MHCVTQLKGNKNENRCCFEEHSKAVTFHTHELMGRVQPVNTLFQTQLTVFFFSMLMPTLIHAQIKKKSQKPITYHFPLIEDKPSLFSLHGIYRSRPPVLQTCFCTCIPPRNFHATRAIYLSVCLSVWLSVLLENSGNNLFRTRL